MKHGPLEGFCVEMRLLAAKIDAPDELIPMCGRDGRSGSSIDMADDGAEYIFSASERGVPYDLKRSPDSAQVMEAVFVDLTERMATGMVVDRYPRATRWRSLLAPFGGPVALKQQREIQIIQEDLLARVDEAWCYRASVENALRLRREVDFFLGLQ